MFNRLKLLIENHDLKEENKVLYKENKENRNETELTNLKLRHALLLANKTLDYLNDLQEIDRLGIAEESKIKHRNVVINEMRLKNIDIIKELVNNSQAGN